MSLQASATFEIESWKEEPWQEQEGVKLTRTTVTKIFKGDIEGQSTAQLLMAYAREGSRAYGGFERFTGQLNGQPGSFILHHSASESSGKQSAQWSILPNSGTDELHSITGTAQITVGQGGKHTLTLNYELASP